MIIQNEKRDLTVLRWINYLKYTIYITISSKSFSKLSNAVFILTNVS